MNHIALYASGNERIAQILEKYGDEIKEDVLADSILEGQTGGYTKEWNINGETVTLGVEKTRD